MPIQGRFGKDYPFDILYSASSKIGVVGKPPVFPTINDLNVITPSLCVMAHLVITTPLLQHHLTPSQSQLTNPAKSRITIDGNR